ncbi:SAP-like protein BP-73 [Nymphaea colorata]|nr:SAP-like protein BP-73 [Nymphaea colorata]
MNGHSIPFPATTSVSFTRRCGVSEKEIADGNLSFSPLRDQIQLSVSSIKSEGSRRGYPRRRNPASDANTEDNDQRIQHDSDGEVADSSNQKEIIALFRRIQSSISKGASVSTPKSKSSASRSQESADAVLEVLRQYPATKPGRGASQGSGKVLNDKRSPRSQRQNKDKEAEDDFSNQWDFRLSRPASNFIKKSPIPSLKPNKEVENVLDATEAKGDAEELQKIDEMKLAELKELAKSKGVKGYSKLKKSELVELLKNSI